MANVLKRIKRKVRVFFTANKFYRFIRNTWWFRKQLMTFRDFDVSYNLSLFCRSLELTRDLFRSDKALSQSSLEAADQIDEFLQLIYDHKNAMTLAEARFGFDSDYLCNLYIAHNEMSDVNKRLSLAFQKEISSIEEDSWNKAADLLKQNMWHWWD